MIMSLSSSSSSSKSKQNSKTYPWSQKKLSSFNPFPRYNLSSSHHIINDKLFLFGGISQARTTNDVFAIEANSLNVLPIVSLGTVPQARSLHTQINVGTNLYVFGGKFENPNDKLDDSIYMLDTDTKDMKYVWCKPQITGNLPSGRYGHTSTLIGTTVYTFGGRNNEHYLNDLISFDTKNLKFQKKKSKFMKLSLNKGNQIPSWNFIAPKNSPPPARSGHVSCVYQNKIYIFGGSDGEKYYNDTWCYDIKENTWTELSCIGYIPTPREFHGATIIKDVMYIFGGRVKEGTEFKELGDICAFRISNLRWYKFPNLGTSPGPRYGLTMTLSQDKVYIFGGESSQTKIDEDGIIHILDTSKLKFPTGTQLSKVSLPEEDSAQSEKTSSVSSLDASNIKITQSTVQQTLEENLIQPSLSPPPRPMSSQSIDASKTKETRPTRTILHQIPEENSSEMASISVSLSNSTPPQSQPPSHPLPPPPQLQQLQQLPPPSQPPPPIPQTRTRKLSKGKEVDRGPISMISPPTISQPKVITSGIIMPQGPLPLSGLKGKMRESANLFQPQNYSPTDSEHSSYELQTIGSSGKSLTRQQQIPSPINLNNNNNLIEYRDRNINRTSSPLMISTRSRINSQELNVGTKSVQDMSIRREPFEIQGTIPEDSTITSQNEIYNRKISLDRTNQRMHRRTASQELSFSSAPRVSSRRRISIDNYSRPTPQELSANYSPRVFPIRRASADDYRTTPQITEFLSRKTSSDNQRITEFYSKGTLVDNRKTASPTTEFPSRRSSTDDQKQTFVITEKSPKRSLVNNSQRSISPITEVPPTDIQKSITELSSDKTLVDDQKSISPLPSDKTLVEDQSEFSSKKILIDNPKPTSPTESPLKQSSTDNQTSSPINFSGRTSDNQKKSPISESIEERNTTSPITETTEAHSTTSPITETAEEHSTTSPITETTEEHSTTSLMTESSSRRTSTDQKSEYTDDQITMTESPTSIDNQNITSTVTEFPSMIDDQRINSSMASRTTTPSTANNQISSILPESLVISRKKEIVTNDNGEKIKNIQNMLANTRNSYSPSPISSIDGRMKRDSLDSLASSDSNQSTNSLSSRRSGKEVRPRGARPMSSNKPNNSSPLYIRTDSNEIDRDNLMKLRQKLAQSKFSDCSDNSSISSSPSEIVVYERSNENTPVLQQSRSQSSNSSVSDFKLNNIDNDNNDNSEIPTETDENESDNSIYEDDDNDNINIISTSPPESYSHIDDENLIQELVQHKSNIEQLKQRESWYKAELDSARKSGFTPDLYDDTYNENGNPLTEIEQMLINEVDNEDIDHNADQNRVIEAIVQMQQKLLKAKEAIANQAEIISEKISSSEEARSKAIQEATYFKTKLETLVKLSESKFSNAESNKAKELENQLIKIVSENKALENQLSELSQSSNLEQASKERIDIDLSRAEAAEKARDGVLAKLAALRLRATTAESQLGESNKQIEKINNELEYFRKETSNEKLQIRNLQSSLGHHQQIFEQVNSAVIAANERAEAAEKL
ncbi:hypothetical protein C1645_722866, partial [Glomus cerebriforme]